MPAPPSEASRARRFGVSGAADAAQGKLPARGFAQAGRPPDGAGQTLAGPQVAVPQAPGRPCQAAACGLQPPARPCRTRTRGPRFRTRPRRAAAVRRGEAPVAGTASQSNELTSPSSSSSAAPRPSAGQSLNAWPDMPLASSSPGRRGSEVDDGIPIGREVEPARPRAAEDAARRAGEDDGDQLGEPLQLAQVRPALAASARDTARGRGSRRAPRRGSGRRRRRAAARRRACGARRSVPAGRTGTAGGSARPGRARGRPVAILPASASAAGRSRRSTRPRARPRSAGRRRRSPGIPRRPAGPRPRASRTTAARPAARPLARTRPRRTAARTRRCWARRRRS